MKFSIITAVYNRVETIDRAIKSVQSQTYEDIEHIIIDGLSSDGSYQVAKNLILEKDVLISEKDYGIYDALNKGVIVSTGDIIGFLHSDDIYAKNNIIQRVASFFSDPDVGFVYGDASFFHPNAIDENVRTYRSGEFSKRRLSSGWMPAHPAFFMRKSIYKKYGLFKTNFRIAGDFEFFCRIMTDQNIPTGKYLSEVLVKMQTGGASAFGFRSTWLLNAEVLRACRDNNIPTNLMKILSKYPKKLLELFFL